jgi:hypothetical protein
MPITTVHQFLDQYPPKNSDQIMICGTIHPHEIKTFLYQFYYGNVASFWAILQQAFPQHRFNSLNEILTLLEKFNVFITDIISQCERLHEGVTRDSELFNIVVNNHRIAHAITNSQIHTIYFTSGFGKNNAAKLFTNAFKVKYRETFNRRSREFYIPASHFGRKIRCIVLYSPSNDANRGIAAYSSQYKNNILYYQQFERPVKQFKIDFYKEKFEFFNN